MSGALIPHTIPQCLMGTMSCTGGHSSRLGEIKERALLPTPPYTGALPGLSSESKVLRPPPLHGPAQSITSSHIQVPRLARSQGKFPGQQHRTPAERCPRLERSLLPLSPPGGDQRSSGTCQGRVESNPCSPPTCSATPVHCSPLFSLQSWKEVHFLPAPEGVVASSREGGDIR